MNFDKLLKYVPSSHGEHGVDSVIHRMIRKSNESYESYCNPPGASWAQIVIKDPLSNTYYSWDQIPRVPKCAKRPDSIIQYTGDQNIHLLAIESKQKSSDEYPDMSQTLKNFFIGTGKYAGLFKRPAWHFSLDDGKSWTFIDSERQRYWINNDSRKIFLYTGFAYAFNPEYYNDLRTFMRNKFDKELKSLLDTTQVDFVIGIGWHGENHTPFIMHACSNEFSRTKFAIALKKIFTPLEV